MADFNILVRQDLASIQYEPPDPSWESNENIVIAPPNRPYPQYKITRKGMDRLNGD